MKNCETCKVLEDLLSALRPDKDVYDSATTASLAVEETLKKHKERYHGESEKN